MDTATNPPGQNHFTAAVIGAGPGGAWTAYRLARDGARVLLVDPSHPREKPCGGGITGRALSIVSPEVALDDLPAVRVRSARFLDSGGRAAAVVPLDEGRRRHALIVASRACFDGLLVAAARRAGATVMTARVTDVVRLNGAFRIDTADGRAPTASFVVGADGANSLVRRRLSRAFRRDQLALATGFFAHGATSDEIVIELLTNPPGYIWSFPRPDHLAIGVCAQADARVTTAALRARTADWIRATGLGHGCRLEPYSWPIPSLSAADFDAIDPSGPGWMLVGDAAGLVDPLTREGIFFALQSAEYAAEALASAAPRPHRTFTHRVRSGIADDLARAAHFKGEFFRPRLTRLLMDALRQSEPIRRVMADLVAGTQSYRGLRCRLARTLELGLAWRVLGRFAEPRPPTIGRQDP